MAEQTQDDATPLDTLIMVTVGLATTTQDQVLREVSVPNIDETTFASLISYAIDRANEGTPKLVADHIRTTMKLRESFGRAGYTIQVNGTPVKPAHYVREHLGNLPSETVKGTEYNMLRLQVAPVSRGGYTL